MTGNSPQVIILNGPPGCGKDTIANRMDGHIPLSFKDELYTCVAKRYRLERDLVVKLCTDRETKEEPNVQFLGLTPREALIHVSEDIIKPSLGNSFFGKCVAANILLHDGAHFGCSAPRFVLSDGGFMTEIAPIAKVATVTVIRLHRDGYDFTNDSRDYLTKASLSYGVSKLEDIWLQDGKIDLAVKVITLIANT